MQTSDTLKRTKKTQGFSLLELLVVLTLMGLIGAVVMPALSRLYDSLTGNAALETFRTSFNVIGHTAFNRTQEVSLATPVDAKRYLALPDGWSAVFPRPVVFTADGICLGGEIQVLDRSEDIVIHERFSPPFCKLK